MRAGEIKKHTYSVDTCAGFKRVHFLYLLFVKLLKHTPLKPMYCHCRSIIESLKTIRNTTNKQLGQPKREGERKRHAYSVDLYVGFKRVHFLYVLFVKLLKHTPLKTHALSLTFYH